MGDHSVERSPKCNFESAPKADYYLGSLSYEKQTRIFSTEALLELSRASYRSIVNSGISYIEPAQIIKNLLLETRLVTLDSEQQNHTNQLIDEAASQYRINFFTENDGKISKNIKRVEELFEATEAQSDLPLLQLAIDIRKSYPKQTNVVEAEHIIRLLILNEKNNEI